MNKLAKIIEKLPYHDLVNLQKDLRAGNLDRLINKRLDEIKPTKAGYCPVCNAEINPDENLTLIFGPATLRQKASFDGTDCHIYFLPHIKKNQQPQH